MSTDKASVKPLFQGFACRSCTFGVIFIPHDYSTHVPAPMPNYKIRILLVACGGCGDRIKKMVLNPTGPHVQEVTEDEVRNWPAYKRMQLLPNAEVVVDDIAHALGAIPVALIGQVFKRGCDIVSLYVSEFPDDVHYEFRPPPASFF